MYLSVKINGISAQGMKNVKLMVGGDIMWTPAYQAARQTHRNSMRVIYLLTAAQGHPWGRGEKAWTSESYHAKLTYHFNEDKSLTYSYLHTDHKYSYEHPFTLIKDASGKSIFYGSVVYPNGKV